MSGHKKKDKQGESKWQSGKWSNGKRCHFKGGLRQTENSSQHESYYGSRLIIAEGGRKQTKSSHLLSRAIATQADPAAVASPSLHPLF